MRGLRSFETSGAGSDRLTLESLPFLLFHRVTIDRAAGTLDYSAGTRLPLLGEIPSITIQRPLTDFDHLRVFAYFDLQYSDGTRANSFRYGLVIEGPVDESQLETLNMPDAAGGLAIATPKTLEETHEIAEEVARFLQMRVLVPARFRPAATVR